MAILKKYPNLYRFTIGLFALYLIGIGIRNFYRYASSTTDDNLFRNSPSHFYITKSFSTHNLDQIVSPIQSNSANLDSIYVGDLLVGINEHIINQDAQVHQLLQTIPNDSGCVLTIFRTTENKFVDYDVSRAALPDSFFQILPVSVYVMEIYPGGASDLAGLKVGDLILRINGETFKDDFDADRILRRAKSGTTIAYDIIRNNQTLTIPVTLANFGVNLAILIVFLSGLVYLSTGTFIAIKSPNILAARLIGLTFMTFGFLLMVTMIQRDVEFDLFATIRTLTLMASLPFTIAFWSHSKSHFPQVRAEIINKHWLSRIPYVLALLFFIIFSLFVFQVIQNNHILNISFIIMLVLMCGYHLAVQSIFHKQRTPEYKKLNRVIFWTGITAGMSALALALILYRSHAYQQMGFIGLPLVFIPLSYLYTIGRYQLLEMKLHVRRNIQYIIVSSLWVTVLVIILLNILITLPNLHFAIPNVHLSGNSIVILDKPPPPQLYDFLQKLLLMFLAIGLTAIFWKISKAGRRVIDRKFYRAHQGYSRAASELAEVMATKLNIGELARGISQKLAKLMQLKRVGVLIFRDQKEYCCHEAFGFNSSKWDEFCLQSAQVLIDAIQKFRSESRFSVDYLPEELRGNFFQSGFRHIIPIRFKNKLSGTLLIGEKLSEVPLLLEDLTFLAAVAKQTSVAIENSFLHTELAGQERLKHELEIARRIQMASLPQRTPNIAGLDIAGISIPAMEVGGDYFDYLNGVTHDITVIVGDVSGKGTSAALYMSKIQGILRSLNEFKLTPRELFIRANQLLCKDLDKNSFITVIGASIDTIQRRLVLARAGHLPLFYYQAQARQVELLTPKGLGLGLNTAEIFSAELEEKIIHYHTDDVFLFVTDGITEAKTRNGGEFGEQQLIKTLEMNSSLSADKIRDQVIAAVNHFVAGSLQHDDQTVVVVKAR